MPAHMRIYKS